MTPLEALDVSLSVAVARRHGAIITCNMEAALAIQATIDALLDRRLELTATDGQAAA